MRFLKLLSKELREAAPFLILTALLVWAIGSGLLYGASPDSSYRGHWGGRPGETLHRGDLFVRSSLGDFGPLILLAAAALGLLLAGRQFLLPSLLKTWAFTLHRAVSPLLILLAKITAAAIGLCFCVGVIWTYLFLRASQPGVVLFRPRPLVLAEGWLMVALGLVVQLGGQGSIVAALRHLPVSLSTVVLLAQPVSVAVLGWLLFNESLGPWHMLGAAGVLVGIYLARRGSTSIAQPPGAILEEGTTDGGIDSGS